MSFFIKEHDGVIDFGGMNSIRMDYVHITSFGCYTIVDSDGAVQPIKDIWIVGSAVTANYVKGRFSRNGLWHEKEISELAGSNDVIIITRLKDVYHIYNNSSRLRREVNDGLFEFYHGCTVKMANDIIVHGNLPTRWTVGITTTL